MSQSTIEHNKCQQSLRPVIGCRECGFISPMRVDAITITRSDLRAAFVEATDPKSGVLMRDDLIEILFDTAPGSFPEGTHNGD